MIIRQVKNLTQTGTVKELTRTYEELQLYAPSEMGFNTPATHLMYYDALKLHVMRHMNLDQVTNLQSLYCKAEKAEQTSNTLPRRKLENKKDPRILTQTGAPLDHPLEATGITPTINPKAQTDMGTETMASQIVLISISLPRKAIKMREKWQPPELTHTEWNILHVNKFQKLFVLYLL
ncbi:hypothetical protein DSO57_1004921 [Entomophthora muscae]|uniref:Uncharacterized protein n=1 Tax=Entomophthora muscae TaxID=34485 RepID=A0ACC2SLD8_9FUNG|nr:hypothetical protein DSO57_1004921 [Entomophthora muscae]